MVVTSFVYFFAINRSNHFFLKQCNCTIYIYSILIYEKYFKANMEILASTFPTYK